MKECNLTQAQDIRILFTAISLIICLLVFPLNDLHSQSHISRYLDDGTGGTTNILKINASSVIIGNLPILLEHVFSPSFTTEVGAGIILPYYVKEIGQRIFSDPVVTKPDGGYSFSVEAKYYVFGAAPGQLYMSAMLRRREYHQDQQRIIFSDLLFNSGKQVSLGSRFMGEFGYGLGFRIVHAPDFMTENLEDYSMLQFLVSINLKIGIKL